MVENIPGLQFIGNQRRPNTKIRVEHVVQEEGVISNGVSSQYSTQYSRIQKINSIFLGFDGQKRSKK